MRVVVAPDSFKGTYTAREVAALVASGLRSGGADAVELPVADGGEGTYEILRGALGATTVMVRSVGPWREPLSAEIALTDDGTALVGLAAASGITVASSGDRDPVAADTYGTGLLVAEAVARGARHVLVAAGGSATTDGGAGAVEAIAAAGGLRGARLTVLCDVVTAFEDAAAVFAPQKGASPEQVLELTARLHRLARDYPRDPRGVVRTGAAGGFAGGLWAACGADLVAGAEVVLDALGFGEVVRDADAIVVGEGRLDGQTWQGKIISAILARAGGVPVHAIVGSIGDDLGDGADDLASVVVAGDDDELTEAGRRLASVLGLPSS